jgi:hypothetical protein
MRVIYGNLKDEEAKIMAEDDVGFLGDKPKKTFLNKYGGVIIIGAAVILMIIAFSTRQNPQISKDCCDNICGKLGSNVTCVGRTTNSEIICKMSYGRFGMPELSEQFVFKVENMSKACAPKVITPIVTSIPSNQTIPSAGDNETNIGGAL